MEQGGAKSRRRAVECFLGRERCHERTRVDGGGWTHCNGVVGAGGRGGNSGQAIGQESHRSRGHDQPERPSRAGSRTAGRYDGSAGPGGFVSAGYRGAARGVSSRYRREGARPVTERLAKWARKNSSYVMFGLKTRSEGKLLNSAILLDRQGRVMGQYHKSHPTENELRKGISPGGQGPACFRDRFRNDRRSDLLRRELAGRLEASQGEGRKRRLLSRRPIRRRASLRRWL